MKYRFGFVVAVGVGLFGQASALAQQPQPPPAPAPAAPSADKPPADAAPAPSDKPADAAPPPTDPVAGQTDPNAQPAPKPAEPTPNAPPAPPPPGGATTAPSAPPPVTLPPYLTGGPQSITVVPPPANTQPSITATPAAPGPGADAGVVPKKKPAYVPWRGTNINWSTGATTTALGIGRDNQSSSHEQISTGFNLTLNYFILDPKLADGSPRGYSLRVQTALGFDTELTDSDVTKTKREPQFRDLPLQAIFSKPLWKSADEEWGLGLTLNGTVLLPTSKVSYSRGMYLTTSPRALLSATVPLRGKKADFLQNVFVGLSGRWDHQFSRANVPTNPDLQRPRQTISGATILSDQLTGGSLETNSLRTGMFLFFSEKLFDHTLWVFLSGGLQYGLLNDVTNSGCVQLATGCAEPTQAQNPVTTRYSTSFAIGASYFPAAEWGFDITYSNGNGQLGLDGQRRNPLYSPDASLNLSVILSLDAIYERFNGPGRDDPFIVFGSNKKQPPVQQLRSLDTVF